ncbi:uncharacterized protein LOC127836919 isoform X1 [Dreissena polymorpha]|uniref:Chitin-binding type-4 domain-containing protein n=2 Tax=Dreissena polymorpha TaxID=45954 RepID=A0A9D4FKN9_DREPO|nr:uncharacterized protein LOC127836919 isoform X1 [Dreissena polymorpha]KAH3799741.1 hypothetical protein DPMN_153355 [Dreissena polymorpha]
MPRYVYICVSLLITMVTVVKGHGRLMEPPSRSSMWRRGFNSPPNYDDNALYCGGFNTQWSRNGGKCGVCGDNFADNPRPNEPRGKFYTGIIVRKYDVGQLIDVAVHLTANHKGWFEFRLCKNDAVNKTLEQACFDQHLLQDNRGVKRFEISMGMENIKYSLKLPAGVTCRACVLQWRYNTGNSWGVDPVTQKGCIGCGPQEQFYGCSDIAIGASDVTTGQVSPNVPVVVPEGDVDDRKWQDLVGKSDCVCPQTSQTSRPQSGPLAPICFVLTLFIRLLFF